MRLGVKVLATIMLAVAAVAHAHLRTFAGPADNPKRFTLVIDAGHGGHDPGAVGKKAKEKDINLATALAFGSLVEANCPDVKVVYTRKTDKFVTLQGRAQIANKNKADLFVSIHTNALPKGKVARGAETYTLGMARANANLEVAKRENSVILVESDYQTRYHGFDPNSSESYIIFEMLQDQNLAKSVQLAKGIQTQFHSAGRQNKGVHQAGFLVLRETTMPGVLVELGYITTADEEQFLASKAGSDKMGRAIYNAFLGYYKQNNGNNAAPEPVRDERKAAPDPVREEPKAAPEPVRNEPKAAPEPAGRADEPAPGQPIQPDEVRTEPVPQLEAPAAGQGRIEFRVQFASTGKKADTSRFADLRDVSCYIENGMYKYTAGRFATFGEAQRYRNTIEKKYKGAFVVALRDGVRMDINEARKQTK